MNNSEFSLYLTIRRAGKTLPYPAQERSDSCNHGFVDLKGHPERINEVPEAQNCTGLRNALVSINDVNTAFYTAGCDYSLNSESNGTYWSKGYLDCIFNDPTKAQDIHAYFKLFQTFDAHLQEQAFAEPIDFHWELEETTFTETDTSGWTLCLWITTDFHDFAESCQAAWDKVCDIFCRFLTAQ